MTGESMTDRTEVDTTAQLQSCGLELKIESMAWEKLMAYCRATNLEVSGFLLMTRDGSEFTIKDAYIVEQESTSTSTEMASTAIARLQMDLFKRKIIGHDEHTKLAHFHTHPTFGVFWSPTDMILRRTMVAGTDYSVALVINQKGEALAAIDINGEFPMSINNLPITIVTQESELEKACKAEVAAKVKSPVYRTYSYFPGGGDDDLPLGGAQGITRRLRRPTDPEMIKRDGETWGAFKKRIKALKKLRRDERRSAPVGVDAAVREFERSMLGDSVPMLEGEDVRIALTAEEIALGRRLTSDDGIWSNENGTWANIGGEVIKIADKEGNPT